MVLFFELQLNSLNSLKWPSFSRRVFCFSLFFFWRTILFFNHFAFTVFLRCQDLRYRRLRIILCGLRMDEKKKMFRVGELRTKKKNALLLLVFGLVLLLVLGSSGRFEVRSQTKILKELLFFFCLWTEKKLTLIELPHFL